MDERFQADHLRALCVILQADILLHEHAIAKQTLTVDAHMQYCVQLNDIAAAGLALPPEVLGLLMQFSVARPGETVAALWTDYDGIFRLDGSDPVLPHDAGHRCSTLGGALAYKLKCCYLG